MNTYDPSKSAVYNEWVLKGPEGYVQSINSRSIRFTDKIEKARKFTGEGYAKSSLTNHRWYYGGSRNHRNEPPDISAIKAVKVRILITEVSE